MRRIAPGHALVALTTSPQARARWAGLPETLSARLLTRTVRGKTVQMLTSMVDHKRYPAADIVDLYRHRREIERGYREMKQSLLQSRLTLRRKRPDRVRQALWGVLLAYNRLRFQMAQMAYSLKGVEPNELSFSQSMAFLIKALMLMPFISPGKLPRVVTGLRLMAEAFVLPPRRERSSPRVVKKRPQRYALRPCRTHAKSLN